MATRTLGHGSGRGRAIASLLATLAILAALALVKPVDGLQTRAHLLILVHPIFPHGHDPGTWRDETQVSAPLVAAGASASALAPAGPFGVGLAVAVAGMVAMLLAGRPELARSLRLGVDAAVLRQQAWPNVLTGPPR